MQSEQSSGGGTVQVVHDELDGAVRILPNQVKALGDTRQLLTSRQVPASAFGDVDSSVLAGVAHNGNVTDTDRGLGNASGRLDGIIGKVRDSGDRLREFDTDQAGNQQGQNQMLAQVAPGQTPRRRPTVVLPDGRTFQPKPGERHIVTEDAEIETGTGIRVRRDDGPGTFQMPDGTEVRRVPEENFPAW